MLTAVAVTSDGLYWQVAVSGMTVTADPASGQIAVNLLIDRASASPYLGAPEQAPILRIGSARSNSEQDQLPASMIPGGMSPVEFTLQFRVLK